MRPAICALLFLAAVVCAQEGAPTQAAGETNAPPPSGSSSGSAATPESPKAEPAKTEPAKTDPQRPSKAAAPTAANYPMQYLLYVSEAMKSFQARDFAGALSYADRADALLPPTVWTMNVRGAVAIEQLNFAEGEKYCIDALKMDPSFFPAKFNLNEIPFLQGKYAAARKGWMILYDRTAPDDPTIELLVYRIFLTYLLEQDMARAKEWLEKLPFPSQTPAYQYAHAAWERQNGNFAKWQEWLESAEFIWPLSKRSSFSDVLLQLKWLKKDGFNK
jgi:hypothetical protein